MYAAKLQIFLALAAFLFHYNAEAGAPTKSDARIVGGSLATDVHIPYIVSLMTYGSHSCGGAIINERTIITAAHCLAYQRPSVMRVHAGSKAKTLRGGGQLIPVQSIFAHELWSMDNMDYDIGLVRLRRPLRYNRYVQPIQLANSGDLFYDGTYGMIAGWGLTQADAIATTEFLRYAKVPVVNHDLCNRLMSGKITERMFCAGFLQGGIDACQMDSGGPLTIEGKLFGIVSWGIGCALPNKPGVYTRVSELLPWVNAIMESEFRERLN